MNSHFGKKVRGSWTNVSLIYDEYDAALDDDED
jgi:hypothetical protein